MQEARNLLSAGLNAGFSLIQQVANVRNANDSSDDEVTDLNEDEEFIQRGSRGILVFTTISIRTGKKKMVHLHLYRGSITQYNDNKKTVFICSDIQSITKNTEKFIVVEFRGAMEVQTRQKRFLFESEAIADRFQQYVEFVNEFGRVIRQSFNQIDYTRTGRINRDDLEEALLRVDLQTDADAVTKMMKFGCAGYDSIDFYNFFHMFLRTYVTNLRECLVEWLILAMDESGDTSSSVSLSSLNLSTRSSIANGNGPITPFDMLPGEIMTFAPKERVYWTVYCSKNMKEPYFTPGLLYLTNYRIVLTSSKKLPPVHQSKHSKYDVPAYFNLMSLPYAAVHKLTVGNPHNSIYISCKDYRQVRLTISGFENNRGKAETFFQFLHSLSFYMTSSTPPGSVTITNTGMTLDGVKNHLFAYKYTPSFKRTGTNAWNLSDMVKEYVREGLYDASEWKLYDNSDYTLASTYPRYLMLPALMTGDQIRSAAAFRSRGRLPAITYRHSVTGAVLTRSAQPLVGLGQKNCPEDELLLNLYRMKGKNHPPGSTRFTHSKLYILDARGKIAATLNMAAGKGTEDVSVYQNTELVFGNIDNIHVMRSSANTLTDNISNPFHPYTGSKEIIQSFDGGGSGYYTKLEESGWLRHLRLILLSGVFAAEKLHFDGHSVLVHCSDGWDRTAQICSTVQLILDPFFRTMEGFAVLVEKEWCAFGHKFQDRCGQGQDANTHPDERSPVFLQFIDSVYQIWIQFPQTFEFNEVFLLFIADHFQSSLFGNFLGNSDKERRVDFQVQELTQSMWGYIEEFHERFVNTSYEPYNAPIWPNTSMHRIKLWERYWLRWDMSAHPNTLDAQGPWRDDWGDIGAALSAAAADTATSQSAVSV